jgi:hypothetical protein
MNRQQALVAILVVFALGCCTRTGSAQILVRLEPKVSPDGRDDAAADRDDRGRSDFGLTDAEHGVWFDINADGVQELMVGPLRTPTWRSWRLIGMGTG